MLINKETKQIQKMVDCMDCEHFDKVEKKCKGLGKKCFEYDKKTGTAIDPITKLPIKF